MIRALFVRINKVVDMELTLEHGVQRTAEVKWP